MPRSTRKWLALTGMLGAALVVDGWAVVPVVDVPRPLFVTLTADLAVELPRRSLYDDVTAMYRGMQHGRPVVNGYSGYSPPHYGVLMYDLGVACVDSLDAARGGRSLDIVIWQGTEGAGAIDAALMKRWGRSVRDDVAGAIIYHLPRAPGRRSIPAVDPSVDLGNGCFNTRPRGISQGSGAVSWIPSMPEPVRIAFLGCGFITRVHSRHLRSLAGDLVCSYASRDQGKAEAFRRDYRGATVYPSYTAAIEDPHVDAVVIAVPPRFHLDLTVQALQAGKHVLVEKPAYLRMAEYLLVQEARNRAGRVVLVGENDHYKPLAQCLRRLLAEGAIGEMVFAYFTSIAKRLKTAGDWRNDEEVAGGDAFFEEGIHWLHLAGSLGPAITMVHGYQPSVSRDGPDTRAKSMMVAFRYDNQAVGSLYYSREIPSLLKGLRLSTLYGRNGIITFESNGLFVLVRGRARGQGLPKVLFPGFRDMRGYRAMYRDFLRAIRTGHAPEMSLERAMNDQRLMDQIYTSG